MINHTGEMTIMNINSRRREQNLTNDADRSCGSHHSPALVGSNGPSLSLFCVSINNTTIYSNEPVRVRPNPRPQKRGSAVWSGLVPKNKRNNKPNHKQFIIHDTMSFSLAHMTTSTRNKQNRGAASAVGRSRFETATTTILAVMLVWVNEKAIFCSDFSRVVFDGLL